MSSLARSRQLSKGDSRKGVNFSSLLRLSQKKRWKPRASSGLSWAIARSMRLHVRRSQQLSAGAEDQAVMGIQPVHGDLFIEISAGGREDLAQNPGVEKKGWPGIEFEAVPLHGGGAAADDVSPFHYGDVDTRAGQQYSGGQATGTGSDYYDFLVWLDHSGLIRFAKESS